MFKIVGEPMPVFRARVVIQLTKRTVHSMMKHKKVSNPKGCPVARYACPGCGGSESDA